MNKKLILSVLLLGATGLGMLVLGVHSLLNPRIVIEWSTATEFQTAGYTLYRSTSIDGPYEKITSELIPASSDPLSGGDYAYLDEDVQTGQTYHYELEEIEWTGVTSREGPITATAAARGIPEAGLGLALLALAAALPRLMRVREAG